MGLHLDTQSTRILLADVPAFRVWVGAADQAEALLRIYRGHEEAYTRPYALVATGRNAVLRRMAMGHHLEEGETYVLFEENVAAGASLEQAWTDHCSNVGAFLVGMARLAGSAMYVHLRGGELERVWRSDLNESPQYHQTMVQVAR